jgi:FkbM family methyltransferase
MSKWRFRGKKSETSTKIDEIWGWTRVETHEANDVFRLKMSSKLDDLSKKIDRMWTQVELINSRLSNYIGEGKALTYLKNGSPIYVNTNDSGGPSNFMNGGVYERENLDVLTSFLRSDSVFLDIGANLGFFSLVVGDRMRRGGRVVAFEPQPEMVELFRRSCFLNGLDGVITIHSVGLSNESGSFSLWSPKGHTGGATLGEVEEHQRAGFERIDIQTVRLDDFLPADFVCDLVKIDVEGHELEVLKGMNAIAARSPKIKILFEKLGKNSGIEDGLSFYFQSLGMNLYAVKGSSLSEPMDALELGAWQGYVLATRPTDVDVPDRRRFDIEPAQLMGGSSTVENGRLVAKGSGLLVHGPYWYLPRGCWRMSIQGEVTGIVTVSLNEKFGHEVTGPQLCLSNSKIDFIIDRDLTQFECVFRGTPWSSIKIDRLSWSRVD